MWPFKRREQEWGDTARRLVREIIDSTISEVDRKYGALRQVNDLEKEIQGLKRTVSELEISKSKKEEEFAREKREVEHMVGLERAKVSFERDKAIQEATNKVQTEALAADKKRFGEEMAFQRARFEDEIKAQRTLMEQILARLPSVEALINVGGAKKRS